jgi:hypothetical protein
VTGSPGATRIRKNTNVSKISTIGTIRTIRVRAYLRNELEPDDATGAASY